MMRTANEIVKREIENCGLNVLDVEFDDFGICVEVAGRLTPAQLVEVKEATGFENDGCFSGNHNLVRNFSHIE